MRHVFWIAILASSSIAAEPTKREWTINDTKREALIALPSATKGAPVVFAFHGHGGTMQNAARSFNYHKHWPEALVVYMQGLNTPGRLTDPEGKKPGWQSAPGDQGDRDLKFFDAVLKTVKAEYQINEKRVYSTGHSNGGGFTYLLWHERHSVFAAVAPSAASSARKYSNFKPLPVMHIAGENDELVKFEWQKSTIETIKKINNAESGKPWHDVKYCTIYASKSDTPVVTYIHKGTHKFPQDEVPAAVVKFFKEHQQK